MGPSFCAWKDPGPGNIKIKQNCRGLVIDQDLAFASQHRSKAILRSTIYSGGHSDLELYE
jgi:hypothetical protein